MKTREDSNKGTPKRIENTTVQGENIKRVYILTTLK